MNGINGRSVNSDITEGVITTRSNQMKFKLLLLVRHKTSTLSYSEMLFSQRFFSRPLLLPHCTVPCKIVLKRKAANYSLSPAFCKLIARFFQAKSVHILGTSVCCVLIEAIFTRSVRLKQTEERPGRSKLIQTSFTEPDVELFMNLTQ